MRFLFTLLTIGIFSASVHAQTLMAESGPDHGGARLFFSGFKEVLGGTHLEYRMQCSANGQREIDGLGIIMIITVGDGGKLTKTTETARCYTSSNDPLYIRGTKREWGQPVSILLSNTRWSEKGKKFEIIATVDHSETKWTLGTQIEAEVQKQQKRLDELAVKIIPRLISGGGS